MNTDARIVFLHHSTGQCLWNGGVSKWFDDYNSTHNRHYQITEQAFPKEKPNGWKNYPYDYWNIWVNNAGETPVLGEPTLEILTKDYDVIVFKHCFPVSQIVEDGTPPAPDINSEIKTLANYKLQYRELRSKLLEFPRTRFIVWTGAALVKEATIEANAERAVAFFEWVKNEWDEEGDNIYIWDFFAAQTEGGLYFKDEYAADVKNSHPNEGFSQNTAPLLCQRIVDVIEDRGDAGSLVGKS